MNNENNEFDQLMHVVKSNLNVLYVRLQNAGYQFFNPEAVLSAPDAEIEQKLALIEARAGSVPEALAAFYRIVGGVDFMGHHPHWTGCEFPDPIVIYPIIHVLEELDAYLCEPEGYIESYGGFLIPIAPDYYHKADVSGGMWYGISTADKKRDPDLLEEWHHTTFISYLRLCMAWAGFPGLEQAETQHNWPVDELKQGLIAF